MDVRRGIGVNMHGITSGTAASLRISVERTEGFRVLGPVKELERAQGPVCQDLAVAQAARCLSKLKGTAA